MIDPNVSGGEDGDPIAIGIARGLAVVDVEAVDDDVAHVPDTDASAVGDVHVGAAPVDGFEAAHHQLLLQSDHHVALEHDPQGARLNHGVPQGPSSGVSHVVVTWVGDHVVSPVSAANGGATEPDSAVG